MDLSASTFKVNDQKWENKLFDDLNYQLNNLRKNN